jgi:3-oxoacyl-[acyl-carrier-protein] synthase-3
MKSSKIIATGAYLPARIITNDELANTIDTSDEWIASRTGIRRRHVVEAGELTSDLGVKAVQDALTSAGISLDSIDGLIVATTTPDVVFPSTAAIIQEKLGIKTGFAFDLNAVCSGFLYAYVMADSLIRTGQVKRIAVIGTETMSRVLDWNDRKTCVLFGDGAGAIILEASPQSDGLLASEIQCDGALSNILNIPGGISAGNMDAKIAMQGREVYRHAIEKMVLSINKLLEQTNLETSNLDWFIPHQANIRIIEAVSERLALPKEKLIVTVDKHANTSAASIPLALDDLYKSQKLKRGQIIALSAVGAGLTWGSAILEF